LKEKEKRVSQIVYQKRQWMKVLWITLPLITLVVLALETRGQEWSQRIHAFGLIALINALVLAVIGSLSIRLDKDELRWSFGFLGWPSWRLPLNNIRAVELCQTRWTEGWGIRFTKEGMLYNAAGSAALKITRADGTSFRLGSADAAQLHASLSQLLAPAARRTR
jgi:hypothetical protein